jgi:hypothetical protein
LILAYYDPNKVLKAVAASSVKPKGEVRIVPCLPPLAKTLLLLSDSPAALTAGSVLLGTRVDSGKGGGGEGTVDPLLSNPKRPPTKSAIAEKHISYT